MLPSQCLKRSVNESGKTVNEIAKAAGVPQPSLCRFMNGTRGMTLTTFDKLASYLKLEVNQRKQP